MRPFLLMLCVFSSTATATFAQTAPYGAPLPAPPQVAASYPPQELDRIVSPIALYPDPLLAQMLSAATFSPEIPAAAQWANQYHYLSPAQLPPMMSAGQLPWQPSVQALLPFPQVLDMMASAMPWTEELGAAFLVSPVQVMDAVQRQRQAAYSYGYLRSNAQMIVRTGPYIEIIPVNPAVVFVPYYDPMIVFMPPRPRFVVAGAIRFGYGINIGIGFAPWGWGTTRFGWNERVMYVNNAPWRRTWTNRTAYVHPYTVPHYNGGNTARPMPRGNGNNTGPRYNGSATAPYAVPRGNGGNAVPYAMPRGNGNNGSGGNTSASRYNGRVNGAQAPRSGGSREQNADRSGQRSSNGRTAERRGGGSRGR